MEDMWLWTCETCGAKTATDCDKFNAADVRCAMCGSSLVGDEKKGMTVVKADRLAAQERLYNVCKQREEAYSQRNLAPRIKADDEFADALDDLERMEADAK